MTGHLTSSAQVRGSKGPQHVPALDLELSVYLPSL